MENKAAPGWFPDPNDPAAERLWDGDQWTANTRPRQVVSSPPPSPKPVDKKKNRIWLWIVVGVVALFVGVQLVVNTFNAATGGTFVEPSAWTCDDLAADAVRISEELNKGTIKPLLLRVESPRVVTDTQQSAKTPSSGQVIILKCTGTGYFSSGETSTVDLTLELDSDGNQWVYYEAR